MNRTIPVLTLAACVFALVPLHAAERPNILWIIGEDASPHLGCYGETAIETPHLDKLAEQGIRFTNAYVTCPVCSPCRSALVTGMYQTTLGTHNHRSQAGSGKGAAHSSYFDSYRLPVKSIPRLYKDAGYWTSNGNIQGKPGKTDYNFIWNKSDYDSGDWKGRKPAGP